MISNQELEHPPEDIGRLINELEDSINDHIEVYLDGSPMTVAVEGYIPPAADGVLPNGIHRLENTLRTFFDGTSKEFTGMDISFTFPIHPNPDKPFTTSLHWNNGISAILAKGHGRPLILVEDARAQKTLASITPERSELASLLNSIGLPDSIHQAYIERVISDLSPRSESFTMSRAVKSVIDLETEVEMNHQARIMRDRAGVRQLVQELIINVDHFTLDTTTPGDDISTHPIRKHRNALSFMRSDDEDSWKYHAAYRGKPVAGQLIDEVEQLDPKLGIPDARLISKVLGVTTTLPY